jgi:hypothetical protein
MTAKLPDSLAALVKPSRCIGAPDHLATFLTGFGPQPPATQERLILIADEMAIKLRGARDHAPISRRTIEAFRSAAKNLQSKLKNEQLLDAIAVGEVLRLSIEDRRKHEATPSTLRHDLEIMIGGADALLKDPEIYRKAFAQPAVDRHKHLVRALI